MCVVRRRLFACIMVLGLLASLPESIHAGNSQYFAETGQPSSNAFYEFWQAHGATEILGLPLSPSYHRKDDRIIQVYERAVLEWHPENAREYRVQLERLGDLSLDGLAPRAPNSTTPADLRNVRPRACSQFSCQTMSPTNHTVEGAFLDYWLAHGGLATFGLPLTEEFSYFAEPGSDTKYMVQYFERNRFEWHPEINGGSVLLGRLGARVWDGAKSTVGSSNLATVPDYDGLAPAPASAAPAGAGPSAAADSVVLVFTAGPEISASTPSSFTVIWKTNKPSSSEVKYGVSSDYTFMNDGQKSVFTVDHSVTISGLTSGSTYHYRIQSRDAGGNLRVDDQDHVVALTNPTSAPPAGSANTSPPPPPAPVYNPPPANTGPVSGSGGSCPAGYPIKANDNSGIYHVPGGEFYDATNARNCFENEGAAQAAGYRRSLR